jgi:hypothetical protein
MTMHFDPPPGLANDEMSWTLTGEERWVVATAISSQIGVYSHNLKLVQCDEDKKNIERLTKMLFDVLERLQKRSPAMARFDG